MRFTTQSCGDAFEVIDRDGRPMTGPLTLAAAAAQRDLLNANATPGALCRVLGAPRNGTRRRVH